MPLRLTDEEACRTADCRRAPLSSAALPLAAIAVLALVGVVVGAVWLIAAAPVVPLAVDLVRRVRATRAAA